MAKQPSKPGSLVPVTSGQDLQEESMECDNRKSYPLIVQWYKIQLSVKWIRLWLAQWTLCHIIPNIQSFPCGIEWGSRRRWSAFSKTWNLPSCPLSSIYSSCGAGGIAVPICPSPTTPPPLLTSTPHSLAPTSTSLPYSNMFPSAVPNATPLPDPSSLPRLPLKTPSPDYGSAESGSAEHGSTYDGNFKYDYKDKYPEVE